MIRFDIVTLFPEAFDGWREHSIVGRAQKKSLAALETHQLRDHAGNKHGRVDEHPFGGGSGMLIQAPPVLRQLEALNLSPGTPVIATAASGEPWTDALARQYVTAERVVVLCGHYEGFDQRVIELCGAREVSVGDFVMTGGELAAMCVVDSVVRLVPGVLGNEESLSSESFKEGLLEGPQYTRPEAVDGPSGVLPVPEVLMSGDHARIGRWRREMSLRRTLERRPDLLRKAAGRGQLGPDDLAFLKALGFGEKG